MELEATQLIKLDRETALTTMATSITDKYSAKGKRHVRDVR